jgi:tetratricopeptide (TPR) repeat protein
MRPALRRFRGRLAAGVASIVALATLDAAAADRPSISLDAFLSTLRRRHDDLTTAQVEKMRRLLALTPDDDPEKPDLWFRMGELFAAKERSASDRARADDERIFAAPAAEKEALRARQRAAEAERDRWLVEAVRAYAAATRFPAYGRLDEVLFRMAYLLLSAKRGVEAREQLHRLLEEHPTSRYVADAYLAFAELAFDQGDINAALAFYEKVAQFPRASVYPYAVYKSGWCQLDLGEPAEALASFVAVVRLAGEARGTALEPLAREARKDLVRAYARVGGPDRAWDFFRRTGGASAPRMLEALAELYFEQGQAADSTRVYRKIIALDERAPRVCAWQGKILRNTQSSGDKREQAQELERLAAVVEPSRPALPECRDLLRDTTRELALVWHKEAERTKNADTSALALRVYDLFLARFPDDSRAVELGFFRGELLWSLERWRDAALQYGKVVDARPDGEHAREAAHAAALAWQKALGGDGPTPAEKAGGPAPPLGDDERAMLRAFDAYLRHAPDAPERVAVEYRRARVYYEHDRFEEAARLFAGIVTAHPTHELAIPFSANLLLDCLNALGRTREALGWVDRFLELPPARDLEFHAQMLSLRSDGLDLEGRDFERSRDFKECGRSMRAAADAVPTHAKHAQRLWNAAICFQNAHLVGRAIESWRALVAAHPTDPLARRAQYRVGAGYHQLAYYGKAADAYEAFARRFPREPDAEPALVNAAAFRLALGDADEALVDLGMLERLYAGTLGR